MMKKSVNNPAAPQAIVGQEDVGLTTAANKRRKD